MPQGTYAEVIKASHRGAAPAWRWCRSCRGHFKSARVAEGGYDPRRRDSCYNAIAVDGYFGNMTIRAPVVAPPALRAQGQDRGAGTGTTAAASSRGTKERQAAHRRGGTQRAVDQLALSRNVAYRAPSNGPRHHARRRAAPSCGSWSRSRAGSGWSSNVRDTRPTSPTDAARRLAFVEGPKDGRAAGRRGLRIGPNVLRAAGRISA